MNTQFKKGVIDLCVLALVSQGFQTVYQITSVLKQTLDVNENTIYPMLRRLSEKAYLSFEKEQGVSGAPKKLYRLTREGESYLKDERLEWETFTQSVQTILGANNE